MNTCDVIIPTYNNDVSLPLVVAGLDSQTVPASWQVRIVICDDGSDRQPTVSASNHELVILPGTHAGAAAARNRGIEHSQADILLLLGADIILRSNALAAHLNVHDQYPAENMAALGFVLWDPVASPTPLMEWLTHGSQLQNDFDALLGRTQADPKRFWYGSHLSLKRSFLGSDRFSEEYGTYGHEDTDLGWRLAARGAELQVLHQAVGLHHHHYSADDMFGRQYAAGQSSVILHRRQRLPRPQDSLRLRHHIQRWLYPLGIGWLLRMLVRFFASRSTTPRVFAHMANYEYRRGLFHTPAARYPQVFPQ